MSKNTITKNWINPITLEPKYTHKPQETRFIQSKTVIAIISYID